MKLDEYLQSVPNVPGTANNSLIGKKKKKKKKKKVEMIASVPISVFLVSMSKKGKYCPRV